jgi:hypothetical protein
VNEAASLSYTFTFDDFGYIDDVIFDWDAEVEYSGEAVRNSDYSITTDFGTSSITVTFEAIDDNLLENVEDAVLNLTGYIEWIAPSSDGSTFYTNILGDMIGGQLERESIAETLTVNINSLPTPANQDVYVLAGSDTPVLNLLNEPVDGNQETVTAVPETVSKGGFSVRIDENGDVVVTEVPDSISSISHTYTVVDDLGAEASASINIATTTLYLINPGPTLFLTDGESAPTFNFRLSNPIKQSVEISATLSRGGFGRDVELLTATIPAGETSVNAELIRVLNNHEDLEPIQSDSITISATVSGNVVPFSVGSQSSDEHSFEIELTDRVTAGLEQASLAEAFDIEPPPKKWSAPKIRKTEDLRWQLRDPSPKRLS